MAKNLWKCERAIRSDLTQISLRSRDLAVDNSLDEGGFAWKMGVKSFLTHANFGRQFAHGDATEPVCEEMGPSTGKDALGDRIAGIRVRLRKGAAHTPWKPV